MRDTGVQSARSMKSPHEPFALSGLEKATERLPRRRRVALGAMQQFALLVPVEGQPDVLVTVDTLVDPHGAHLRGTTDRGIRGGRSIRRQRLTDANLEFVIRGL